MMTADEIDEAPQEMKKNVVEARMLNKTFRNVIALRDLNISIPEGITYGLLGPNGAGKTTFVRILCSLAKPDSGEIRIFGNPVSKAVTELIGYMPQDLALYLDLSVMDNIRLYGVLSGLGNTELKIQADRMLDLVGLTDRKNTIMSELSGGMKRKVSLVCSMIHRPRLLILDEPTVGVDPILRAALWSYFDEIKKSGTTIVITTHYMDEAKRCDEVGIMQNGSLIIEGSPDHILQITGTDSLEDAFVKLSSKEEEQ